MDGFTKRTEEKKQAIVEAAEFLFKRNPPGKVGVRDIAARAGVSTFSIYNYYGSKRGLIFELVKQLATAQVEALTRIAEGSTSFAQKIEAIVFRHTQAIWQFHPEFTSLVIADPEIRTYLGEKYQERLMGLFMSVIDQGRREGCVDAELPNTMIVSFIQLLNQDASSTHSVLLANRRTPDFYAKALELILYGISGKRRPGGQLSE